jgi:hypothetical protein
VSHTSVGRVATAFAAVYLLLAADGRSQVPDDSVRVTSGPIYRAADGSRSVLRPIVAPSTASTQSVPECGTDI